MKKWVTEHRIPFLLLTILLFVQSFSIDLNNPYRKPISGDAQAYYAYLPAIFIYRDLEYKFVSEMQQKYYVAASSKSFLKDVNGEKVNKTFPGVTVLYAPFFFAAHGIAIVFGLPADGYSNIYQLFYLIGFWFYFLLGMIFFTKVLIELDFSKRVADLSLVLIILGTNIFFYSVYDQSVTHIYSFFLVNWSVYLLLRLKKDLLFKKLILLISILALIGITRPTNILVVFVLYFFIPDLAFYKGIIRAHFKFKNVLILISAAGLILAIPFILWKLQTGNWIVYSYGEEGFQFLNPEITLFLFSYTKGWLIYTPVMLFILIFGFIILFKKSKNQFFIGLLFFSISIYIFSSWWCWYYGAGMSQRVMIDFYIVPGFLLGLILQKISGFGTTPVVPTQSIALPPESGGKSLDKNSDSATKCIASPPMLGGKGLGRSNSLFFLITTIFLFFNIAQAYQISKGILPFGSPTKEQYWDNFLVFKKHAQVYPQEHWAFVSKGDVSFDPADLIKGDAMQMEHEWCLHVTENLEYSAVAQLRSRQYKKGQKLIFTFEAKAIGAIEKTRLVFQFGELTSHVFFMKEYISDDWEKMQYLIEIDKDMTTPVDIYLWNAGAKENVDLRNLSWKIYFSDEYF